MDLKQTFLSFDGRMARQSFWLYGVLALGLLNFIGGTILGVVSSTLALLLSLALLWPSISISAKRCHDRGRSGWFLLIGLIPVVGGLWLLVELGFLRGTVGANPYGDDPVLATTGVTDTGGSHDWHHHRANDGNHSDNDRSDNASDSGSDSSSSD